MTKIKKSKTNKSNITAVELKPGPDTYSIVCTFAAHDTDSMKTIIDAQHNRMLVDGWYDACFRPYFKYDAYANEIKLCNKTMNFICDKLRKYFEDED